MLSGEDACRLSVSSTMVGFRLVVISDVFFSDLDSNVCLILVAASFDPAKFLNTHRDLLSRTYNRPQLNQLSTQAVKGGIDETSLAVSKERCF